MGYSTRSGSIRTYWPDDTDTEMYLDAEQIWTQAEIQARIDEKWPGASAENIVIDSRKIQTDCLGYDLYDPGDYTDFIIIRRLPGA
jgi:hypothetical protein